MKRNKRILFTVLAIVVLLLVMIFSAPACSTTYKGKVIDADTKQPIEGAVVVASWKGERGAVAGGTSRLEDVKEILTDKNGEWMIKGPRGTRSDFLVYISTIFTFLTGTYYTEPPLFIVFKPGYCAWPHGFMTDVCTSKMIPRGHDKVADGETVELPRLTKRVDRLRSLPGTVGFGRKFDKKQLIFLKLIDDERKSLFGTGDLQDYIKELENEK